MRENSIPPMRRLSRITKTGRLEVDVSSNWMQELYDYEQLGSIELFAALKKKRTRRSSLGKMRKAFSVTSVIQKSEKMMFIVGGAARH